jgi:hypothetical protein
VFGTVSATGSSLPREPRWSQLSPVEATRTNYGSRHSRLVTGVRALRRVEAVK